MGYRARELSPVSRPNQPSPTPLMQARDLYVVIGVPFNASSQDIRAAYLRKSLETHPDKGGDEALFRDVRPLPSCPPSVSPQSNMELTTLDLSLRFFSYGSL